MRWKEGKKERKKVRQTPELPQVGCTWFKSCTLNQCTWLNVHDSVHMTQCTWFSVHVHDWMYMYLYISCFASIFSVPVTSSLQFTVVCYIDNATWWNWLFCFIIMLKERGYGCPGSNRLYCCSLRMRKVSYCYIHVHVLQISNCLHILSTHECICTIYFHQST